METFTELVFFVNGKKIIQPNPDPELTLLTYIRDNLYLCGTKSACGEGGCGACTVMVSKIDRSLNKLHHMAINACITPLCSMHGYAVTTVEGIGSTVSKIHPIQERLAKAHGSQCGFCTPGFVMSMYALLRSLPKPSMKDMEIAFQGNLCRCTGYRPIFEGLKTFTKEFECAMGDKCCKVNGNGCDSLKVDYSLFENRDFAPYDQSQEPIFPPELKLSGVLDCQNLIFRGPRVTWYRPTSLNNLLKIKKDHHNAKIAAGNTEIGIEVKFKNSLYPVLINPTKIPELTTYSEDNEGIWFGAAMSLEKIKQVLESRIESLPERETRFYQCVVDMLHYFAGKQIRNVATLGGNIMTGSPISDLSPIFLAAGVQLIVESLEKKRTVVMGADFFTGYRKNVIASNEVVVKVLFPKTSSDSYIHAYKQAKRREDDIAIVTSAMFVKFETSSDIIKSINIAFGGMAATTVLATETSKWLVGQKWSKDIVESTAEKLGKELVLSPQAPGGMVTYRRALLLSLFFKSFLAIASKLNKFIPVTETSGSEVFKYQEPKGVQVIEKVSHKQPNINQIGRPKVHVSAFKQACGEAPYLDDIEKARGELFLAFVLSTKARATIISIDDSKALALEGVHAFFSSKNLNKQQNIGGCNNDEEIFSSSEVNSQGQIIGAVVADNQALAQRAAKLVVVVYKEISPIIVTIEDAIIYKSFYPGSPYTLSKGDTEKGLESSNKVIEGSFRVGGQEHFYLETNGALAIPRDADEIEVFSATQNLTITQTLIANTLSLPRNKVHCRVKRLGGGFGGKEIKSILVAVPVAYAAHKLKRPVRCVLNRDEDMIMTGNRHPFLFKYRVGFNNNGKINACEVHCYNNGGYTLDLSEIVLGTTMSHIENCYYIPNMKVLGYVCKTNLPSNTVFRASGAPQGMVFAEHLIRHVARACCVSYEKVQQVNMYAIGDTTHYNQTIEDVYFKRCWEECLNQSNFYEERKQVEEFNKQNRWRKRGISIVPTKYGLSFGGIRHLLKGGALVNIYEDGSVLVSHAGIEIGQGIHTKMIQIASKVLEISTDLIHISETATDKIPNATQTAASMTSDLNGPAVIEACEILAKRIAPYKKNFPNGVWSEWVNKAYLDCVNLSATGFYEQPVVLDYNPETNTGRKFVYFTNGAGVSVVEIDCLTGDHKVLKTDIVMDVGSSLNPAIDIGQIEGAFIQGYGLFTMEELIYSPTGTLYSRGPGTYKIPGYSDIPTDFNVSLLTGSSNPRAVYSSKAIGEPPLFLGSTPYFAIREAISAARKEQGYNEDFELNTPATAARIRMACEDKFTEMIKINDALNPVDGIPWNVVP